MEETFCTWSEAGNQWLAVSKKRQSSSSWLNLWAEYLCGLETCHLLFTVSSWDNRYMTCEWRHSLHKRLQRTEQTWAQWGIDNRAHTSLLRLRWVLHCHPYWVVCQLISPSMHASWGHWSKKYVTQLMSILFYGFLRLSLSCRSPNCLRFFLHFNHWHNYYTLC